MGAVFSLFESVLEISRTLFLYWARKIGVKTFYGLFRESVLEHGSSAPGVQKDFSFYRWNVLIFDLFGLGLW